MLVVASLGPLLPEVAIMRTVWRILAWVVVAWAVLAIAFFFFFSRHGQLPPH